MSALERLVKHLMCTQLKAKLSELESRLSATNNEVEKLKIEAMIEIISRVYDTECRG